MSVKLLVVDDHEVIRSGLASLLSNTDIQIVAEAASGKEAIKQAEKCRPDVILLDVRMPDGDGLAALVKLRKKVPESRVVMLSTYDNPTYIARSVALGASDYVLKGSSRESIIATITAAAKVSATMALRCLPRSSATRNRLAMMAPRTTGRCIPVIKA